MASKEHKIIRRASALNELSRLSALLAKHFDITMPDVQITNRDNDLAEIQRIESINGLLAQVVEGNTTADAEPAKAKAKQKHGANK